MVIPIGKVGAGALSEFVAEFDIYMGGPSGGEGMSFNLGALPPTYFGERGARSGLSVQVLMPARRVEVWYAHTLLAQSTGNVAIRAAGLTHVSVAYGGSALSVIVGGAIAVANVTVASWCATTKKDTS